MGGKFQVFISSTMEDLGNERRAVVDQLLLMGIEPINAEEIPPTGSSSWNTIQKAIESCHLVILILGDRHGWIPDSGYGFGKGKSVTQLEIDYARSLHKPIIPFVKSSTSARISDPNRDAFINEIKAWDGGYFVRTFTWANELGKHVRDSITKLWVERFESSNPSRSTRDAIEDRRASRIKYGQGNEVVSISSSTMMAGAGLSIAAGYPSAVLLMGILSNDLWKEQPDPAALASYGFGEMASYYASIFGRSRLVRRVGEALLTPQIVTPTLAHSRAVRVFKNIVTSNYDRLFEEACEADGLRYRVVTPGPKVIPVNFDGLSLYKIAGTIDDPATLALTVEEQEAATKSPSLAAVPSLLAEDGLVIVGLSLRDHNVQQLLKERRRTSSAFYVSPSTSPLNELMHYRYGLVHVDATADEFFSPYRTTFIG